MDNPESGAPHQHETEPKEPVTLGRVTRAARDKFIFTKTYSVNGEEHPYTLGTAIEDALRETRLPPAELAIILREQSDATPAKLFLSDEFKNRIQYVSAWNQSDRVINEMLVERELDAPEYFAEPLASDHEEVEYTTDSRKEAFYGEVDKRNALSRARYQP